MFRRVNNQNFVIGVILLIALLFLAGPGTLPRFLARFSPYFEGIPCGNVRTASDRANHQSLLGRSAENPLVLSISTSGIPTDPAASLLIQITVINNSVGSVPFIYNPNEVIIGDNNSSGLGIVFTPNTSLATTANRQDTQSYPENEIRILGPRQRCVHTIDIAGGNVQIDPQLRSGNTQVYAFYRGASRGAIPPPVAAEPTPIYPDQGLPTGVVRSDSVLIPIAGQ
jgi:hypothetical protein